MTMSFILPIPVDTITFERASSATYLDASGVLQTAAANVRRPLFVSGLQDGFIYEPAASVNLLTNSRADSNVSVGGAWTLGSNTTRVGSTASPDGTVTATTYKPTTGPVGNTYIIRSVNLAANTSYTLSVWAKLVAGSPTRGEIVRVSYDSDGTAGTLETKSLQLVGSGISSSWQRFFVTFTNAAAVTGANFLYVVDPDIGVEVAIWGAQLEVGRLSSFIPTTTATVTRSAEYVAGVTDNFVSSTVPELDYPAWNPLVSYTIGDRVTDLATHRVYENELAGVDATRPQKAPTRWLDTGPSNRWAMFDSSVNTLTVASASITVVIKPGQVDSLALQELRAESVQVVLRSASGGPIVYDRFIDLEFSLILDFYDWFFEPYEQRSDAVLTDLPPFPEGELTVIISGAARVEVGVLVLGNNTVIGDTQYGAQLGILNFAVKDTDAFGNVTVVPRGYARRMDLTVWAPSNLLNRIYRRLSEVRDIPCVWIATEGLGYESLIIYGFYRDFTIDVAYFDTNVCNLQIEGLV